MKKNLFFTLCFSFCPGAGQMYQGYMKRGLSILIVFAIFAGLFATVGTPIFAIPLPVIFIYSFFDTFNIRSLIGSEDKLEDKYIWEGNQLFDISKSLKSSNTKKIIGFALIFIGIYILLVNMLPNILYTLNLNVIARYINRLSSYFVPIAIALLSIFLGIKLIRKK